MEPHDPSASECLRLLLEEQQGRLRNTAETMGLLHATGVRITAPMHWSGLARNAHDAAAQRMVSQLTVAREALDRAADHSARAVATLATRV